MITKERHVADVVTDIPKSADIFRKYGIDFCCGGDVSIDEAVSNNKKVDLETLLNQLNSIPVDQQNGGIDIKYLDASSLIQYIQSRYHEALRTEFQNLTPYVTKLAKVHGPSHPYLLELKDLYTKLKSALLEHIDEEDHQSFLKLIDVSAGKQVDQLNETITSLVDEHDEAGQLLREIRAITNDYQPPLEACGTWRLVYQRLEQLERDTHVHVHLENHVLFKKYKHLL
ncbi:iron-sulfur cluster repair di-iron protein ScdA [Mammaliicoccus sciuri]|uniref:iron-sulfur cluster repair di-iron protein ScdA n=1 Tax=Mammaliicoccus sciuri TaxID=1296 RepID=UPI002DB90FF2|nr:iron-sulfur cluster repair di-iron protein ScdA [Mammaliicoccus sciuri]MEB5758757.1 iron-sulfur cluster repair di-iron protein ScdA [Mammaliicoccus sciuri]MEB7413535.1 iron-sulfur cluster repair di-iron protein ScdA [Mammaliicoccus sciuri]